MQSPDSSAPWLVPVRNGNDLFGSGIVVAERAIVTCLHVAVVAAAEVQARVGRDSLQSQFNRRVTVKDAVNDLAILETVRAWPQTATLVAGVGSLDDLDPRSSVSSVGYQESTYGEPEIHESRVPRSASGNAGNSVGLLGSSRTRFFRAEVLVPEGFSGGALRLANHPKSPVLGVNISGGKRAPLGGFAPADAVISLMSRAGLTPHHVLDWEAVVAFPEMSADAPLQPLDRIERWRRLLNLPSSRVTLTFNVKGRRITETFRLVPPAGRCAVEQGAQQPVLMQESMICDALCGASADITNVHRGLSPRNALKYARDLSAYYDVPFRLPTYPEWLNALTSAAAEPFSFYRPREALPAAPLSRFGRVNSFRLRLPPGGLFELVVDSAAAVSAQRAYVAEQDSYGAPVFLSIGPDEGEPSVSFRLVVPALASLGRLNPVWQED